MNSKDRFLEESAGKYQNDVIKGWEGLYKKKRRILFEAYENHFTGENALECGCADGVMTRWLAQVFRSLTVVDGSQTFIDETKKKIVQPNVEFIFSMFEDYVPSVKYDAVIMTYVLEHLDDPVMVLKKTREWLTPGGKVFIAVPNADSLHRLVGVKMGLLKSKSSLNEQDVILGHKRVYTKSLLREHVTEATYSVEQFGGIMLKPISNRQIEKDWSPELIDAFFEIGKDFPDMCSEIYMVLSSKD